MKLGLIPILLGLTATPTGAGVKDQNSSSASASQITIRTLDANRIQMWVNDRGYLWQFSQGGASWPDTGLYGYENVVVYDHGPWIIGKVNGVPSAAMTLWESSFAPGPIIDGQPALWVHPEDSFRYHPYKISYDSPPDDSDLVNWPKDLGAPSDPQGEALLLGDQLVWSVYNGADTTAFPVFYRAYNTQFPRITVEIHQSFYEQKAVRVNDTSLLANTAFLEWTFINKGNAPVESCYVGFWSDIDFYDADQNVPGVDTSVQLGYCWLRVPGHGTEAVGYELLFGPAIPEPGGTATFRGRKLDGYRNMSLSSFRGILNDYGHDFLAPPSNIDECWNVARGYDQAGETIIDSVSKLPTRFPYSGDPVTNTGWVYSLVYTKGSAGILMFSGPFILAVGDTQWMMIALIPADAGDRLASIDLMRQNARRLSALSYDQIAHPRTLGVDAIQPQAPTAFGLYQNYPNPFNPSTTIRYGLPVRLQVTLTVYNTLGQQVAALVKGEREAGYHEAQFNGSALSSGVYFCRLQAGTFSQTRKFLLLR